MTLILTLLILAVLTLSAIVLKALPENKLYWALAVPLAFVLAMLLTIEAPPKIIRRSPQSIPPRSVEHEVHIDIVDSSVDKSMIQVIIYYRDCIDRINLKKNALKNIDLLNKAVKNILNLRDETGGCPKIPQEDVI